MTIKKNVEQLHESSVIFAIPLELFFAKEKEELNAAGEKQLENDDVLARCQDVDNNFFKSAFKSLMSKATYNLVEKISLEKEKYNKHVTMRIRCEIDIKAANHNPWWDFNPDENAPVDWGNKTSDA